MIQLLNSILIWYQNALVSDPYGTLGISVIAFAIGIALIPYRSRR